MPKKVEYVLTEKGRAYVEALKKEEDKSIASRNIEEMNDDAKKLEKEFLQFYERVKLAFPIGTLVRYKPRDRDIERIGTIMDYGVSGLLCVRGLHHRSKHSRDVISWRGATICGFSEIMLKKVPGDNT